MSNVLTINGGSSSIRFAVYAAADASTKLLDGKIEHGGVSDMSLTAQEIQSDVKSRIQPQRSQIRIDAAKHPSVTAFLIDWLVSHPLFATIGAIGHRVVHGMQHSSPERVTPDLLAELKRLTPYDPEHLPLEIELIEALGRHGDLPQVACFDTAFHRTMPRVATILPIPRRYEAKGVQRYGFHGLSYTYLMAELVPRGGPAAAHGRVILAHLGNGASLAAVRDGRCIDTSMGFTPAAGLVMGTRAGDLDPGIAAYLAFVEGMDAAAYQKMITHESGLLGVSESSADIRDLLAREDDDPRAAEAVALFCYQAKQWIGAFVAALGGIDTLVFAGGIGENSAVIRSRICDGLAFLGIELNHTRNAQNAAWVSEDSASVTVHVIRTDEESVIASSTIRVLNLDTTKDT